ncbi:hypothetical protein ABTY61_02730 [Kitasatospora sp. NPDC096128]|uniref:hypothetical protein n=1 Tax=Kitasatospora sp. NPDC096128 TaxID=3155547 RepID=UPI0033302AB3
MNALKVRATPGRTGGLVIGQGGTGELARRYAEALKRPFLAVADTDQALRALDLAAERGDSAFVLPAEEELGFHEVNALMGRGRELNLPVGVLPLPADRTEAAELVVRAAALHAPTPRHRHRSLYYTDFRRTPPADRPGVYGSAQSGEFIEQLRSGAEAVVLHSHGNGADFRVGEHVLCLQVDRLKPAPAQAGERFLPCQGGGPCRLDHKSGFRAFHGAQAVRARLLVLLSCSAYQPHDGLLGARFQLSQRLLRGAHVAGVVASTRINHGTPQLGVAVAQLLQEGASLGEVALRVNRLSAQGPASYVCLGDPDLVLPPADAAERPDRAPAAAAAPARPTTATNRPATAPARAATAPARAAARPWQSTVDLLFAAEFAAATDSALLSGRFAEAAVASMRAPVNATELDTALLRLLAAAPEDAWQQLCRPTGSRPDGHCPACGGPATETEYAAVLHPAYRRTVRRCAVHGLLSDTPAGPADVPLDARHHHADGLVRWDPGQLSGWCTTVGRGGGAGRSPAPVPAGTGSQHLPEPTGEGVTLCHAAAGAFSRVRVFTGAPGQDGQHD